MFTQVIPNMERTPLNFPAPPETFMMPYKGGMDWASATVDHRGMVENCIQRFREYISGRRLLVKPTFEKFDKSVSSFSAHSLTYERILILDPWVYIGKNLYFPPIGLYGKKLFSAHGFFWERILIFRPWVDMGKNPYFPPIGLYRKESLFSAHRFIWKKFYFPLMGSSGKESLFSAHGLIWERILIFRP